MTFIIQTYIPGLCEQDEAEAEGPENAFCAVVTLLRDCGTMHARARVYDDNGHRIWDGEMKDALRVIEGGKA